VRQSTISAAVRPSPSRRHPISRWYVVGAAAHAARWLAPTRVRPVHLTAAGLLAAAGAAGVLCFWPAAGPWAALLVFLSWFFDRADGLLARRQQSESAWGAWLDANVDELVDVGLHVAVASAAARLAASQLPWFLLVAFVAGKHLFFHGLTMPESSCDPGDGQDKAGGVWRWCYHLPGNADVRVHLLVAALLTGYLATELALVAAYYNVRWLVRYVLVARRLGGSR